ncbi:isoleucine--tRNA ligase [Rubrivirga sp. IMCC43871]|uniref:isoleucine--tRNA ligase n=1 Tax=Rubrivirga sp. IMCC43871 TaxID=3391575 RepID=UPI003990375B
MPVYPEVESFDAVAVEEAVLAQWAAADTFRQSLAIREGAPHFVFYEGPPTANGKPGIHHVMARTIKDLFCRYKTMQGFRVDRKAGWDTHGLPVEIEVEKELGLEGRDAIEAFGIAEYNAACRASVLKYKDLWDDLTVRMGYWVDLSDPYVTFETDYIESVWNLLKRIHDKGLLTKGHKIQWYSPANGTVLSSHEVSLGYKEVQDASVIVRARLVEEPRTSLLAWTTTPWTVPANAAMAVGSGIHYVKARQMVETETGTEEEFLIVAKSRAGAVLKGDYEIVAEMTGADLVGKRYTPMWADADPRSEYVGAGVDAYSEAWQVVAADYVTTDDGTGIVHTAPAFGMDDWATGTKHGLPTINPIRPDGTFEEGFGALGGMWFKDADRVIIRDLAARGLLYREDSFVHNYPHDWRKGTPLMQYPVESWFIRTTAVKDRLVALNETINWQPEGIGTGRFGQWLENNVDWAISRMRFWGTPLPIWVETFDDDRTPEEGEEPYTEVVGSVDELRAKVGGTFPEAAINPELGGLDLHRPYVDALTWPGPNGGTMRRVEDLLDVWFDSGAMPYAQWHYPFENVERFEANVPADFIAEGVDQTRGWFYTMHAIAALVDDRVAYKNVVVNGLVLDAEGNKMSKSKGNAVEPFGAIARHGADPIRWSMMSASPPWEDLRYSDTAVEETTRKFFGTLVNTYRFFATYANLDGYAYDAATALVPASRSELDRWILSRLQSTVAEAVVALDGYHPTRAARAVEAFVDDLSNWWLRRSRRRFWSAKADGEASGPDKQAAYDTLWESLEVVSRLMAPIAPFTSEWLYGVLGHTGSVHLQRYPTADGARLDADLEDRMALARAVTTATLALRNEAGINVRQPLASVLVVTGVGGVDESTVRSVEGVILDEVNLKRLETAAGDSGVVAKRAKPNFKALGRRLGKRMKAVNEAVRGLDSASVARYEADGQLELLLPDGSVVLGPGDLDIESEGVAGHVVRQETATAADGSARTVTVSLDTTLDDALRAEGVAREVVNRIQNLRKEAGFAVSDRIAVEIAVPPALAPFIAEGALAAPAFAATVRAETLAETVALVEIPDGDLVQTVEVSGAQFPVGVRKL